MYIEIELHKIFAKSGPVKESRLRLSRAFTVSQTILAVVIPE